jgi:predicted RecB family nuclease
MQLLLLRWSRQTCAMTAITATQLYSYLACPHRVVMDVVADPAEREATSPFLQMLWERGTIHERDVIAGLDMPCLDLSVLKDDAKEAATREAVTRREPLIYGGRLSVHELLGEPDLLRLEQGGYAAIDIKSGAGVVGNDGEVGSLRKDYGVQLALYTDILTRMGLAAGRFGYIWDVHRAETRYDLDAPLGPRTPSLWDIYLKTRAAMQSALAAPQESGPALGSACKQCVWHSACFRELKRTGDLTLLPELGRARRDVLAAEFPALADLAAADLDHYTHGASTDFPGVGAGMLARFKRRAVLQLASNAEPYLTQAVQWPDAPVQLFFDIETDPMRNFCYLHGFVIRDGSAVGSVERFEGVFAADVSPQAEREAFAQAMALFRRYSAALVVHYTKFERTEYRRLAARYPDVVGPEEIEALFAAPRALDLFSDVVRPRSEWPTHDYSIKSLAKCCGFSWRDADPSGASSIEWFDRWARTGDERLRQRLLDYNEDDCRAMRVVLDCMRELPIRSDA